MIGWEQLIKHEIKPIAKTIEEFAEHTSKEDVMLNHGWFYFSDGAYRWHKTRTQAPTFSGCQLAIYFNIHEKWLYIQKI